MSAVRPPFDVALPAITDEILEAYGGGFTFIEQSERDWTQEAVDFAAEVVRPAVQRRIRELEAALREAQDGYDRWHAAYMDLKYPNGSPPFPGASVTDPETLCEGCPPVGYPTDETRCTPYPRRGSPS